MHPSPRLGQALRAVAIVACIHFANVTAQRPIVRLASVPPMGLDAVHQMVTATSEDTIYVAWTDVRGGLTQGWFQRSLDRGNTWLPSEVPFPPPVAGSCGDGAVRIATSGAEVHVIYDAARGPGCVGNLYYNRSTDRGATWLATEVQVTTLGQDMFYGSSFLAVAAGQVFVAWNERPGWTAFARSADGGVTWNVASRRWQSGARFAVDGAGTVHVVWNDSAYALWFNRSLDGGATWLSADVQLSSAGHAAELEASGGRVFVSWSDRSTGVPRLRFDRSLDGGLTWLPAQPLLDAATAYVGAKLLVEGNRVTAVFPGIRQLWSNRSLDAGATWLASPVLFWSTNDLWGQTSTAFAAPGLVFADHTYMVQQSPPRMYHWLLQCSGDGGVTWTGHVPPIASQQNSVMRTYGTCGTSVYALVHEFAYGRADLSFQLLSGDQGTGNGTPGTGNVEPRVESVLAPSAGLPSLFRVANGLGGAASLLAIGIDPSSRVAQPFFGGTLLVAPDAVSFLQLGGTNGQPGAGTAPFSFTLPVQLLGLNLNFQAFVVDPAGPAGAAMSRRLEAWF